MDTRRIALLSGRGVGAALIAVLSAVCCGCGGDTEARWALCTDFSGATTTNCEGTVVIVVHDEEDPGASEFSVTVRRVDLLSSGRVFTFFEGARREDMLEFADGGFLLGRRDSVPLEEFDELRIDLTDLTVSREPFGEPAEHRLIGTPVTVALDPPLKVSRGSPAGLRIDIDVSRSLAGRDASGGVRPIVRAFGNEPEAALAPAHGKVISVHQDRNRFLFEASAESGRYWVLPPGPGAVLDGLIPGSEIILDGAALRGVDLYPRSMVLVSDRRDGRG